MAKNAPRGKPIAMLPNNEVRLTFIESIIISNKSELPETIR